MPSEPGAGPLTVEVTQVHGAAPAVEIALSVRNVGPVPGLPRSCSAVPAVVVEAQQGAGWQEVSSANVYCIAVLIPRREVLPPGATMRARLSVVVEGQVRLRVLYGETPEDPYAAALSRPLELTERAWPSGSPS